MCTRCTMEYYPAIEKSKIPSSVAKHTGLEDTMRVKSIRHTKTGMVWSL